MVLNSRANKPGGNITRCAFVGLEVATDRWRNSAPMRSEVVLYIGWWVKWQPG